MYAKYTSPVQKIGTLAGRDTFSRIPTRYIGGIQLKERLISEVKIKRFDNQKPGEKLSNYFFRITYFPVILLFIPLLLSGIPAFKCTSPHVQSESHTWMCVSPHVSKGVTLNLEFTRSLNTCRGDRNATRISNSVSNVPPWTTLRCYDTPLLRPSFRISV